MATLRGQVLVQRMEKIHIGDRGFGWNVEI